MSHLCYRYQHFLKLYYSFHFHLRDIHRLFFKGLTEQRTQQRRAFVCLRQNVLFDVPFLEFHMTLLSTRLWWVPWIVTELWIAFSYAFPIILQSGHVEERWKWEQYRPFIFWTPQFSNRAYLMSYTPPFLNLYLPISGFYAILTLNSFLDIQRVPTIIRLIKSIIIASEQDIPTKNTLN